MLIDKDIVERVLLVATKKGVDFAEVFCEERLNRSFCLDGGFIEDVSSGFSKGVGIRVIVDGRTGFAHTADISEKSLIAALDTASSLAKNNIKISQFALRPPERIASKAEVDPTAAKKNDLINQLKILNEVARKEGNQIQQVTVRLSDSKRSFLVANTDGIFREHEIVRAIAAVSCVAIKDGNLQTGYETLAKTADFAEFFGDNLVDVAKKAAKRAIIKLDAAPAPSGKHTVVLEGGSGGILFHEACGHGLEADHIIKNASVYVNQIGNQVASELVTLVDRGNLAGEWGYSEIDDEGNQTKENVLIKEGILLDYMWDTKRSMAQNRQSTGNGRRQSYKHLPMVRMTNTYLLPGSQPPQEIISNTKAGVYVKQLAGGQVNTATGDFVFGTSEAYLIEDGKITRPLRDANLIGNGPEILKKIDAVANDISMTAGTCGKDGQQVPVGCGQPTLRITDVTIGGTA